MLARLAEILGCWRVGLVKVARNHYIAMELAAAPYWDVSNQCTGARKGSFVLDKNEKRFTPLWSLLGEVEMDKKSPRTICSSISPRK